MVKVRSDNITVRKTHNVLKQPVRSILEQKLFFKTVINNNLASSFAEEWVPLQAFSMNFA